MKENIDKKKAYKFFILLLSIVLLIVVFANMENQEKFLGLFKGRHRSSVSIAKDKTIGVKDIEDAACYDDCIVVHSKDRLIGYSFEGRELWKKDIVLKNYSLFFGDENIFVYEKTTGYIQFINKSGEIFKEMNMGEEIKGLKKDYDNIVVYTAKAGNEKVYIIDKNTNVREINDLELKNILTYSVSKDYASYGISTLNLESDTMDSRFTVFKYGKEVLYRKDFKNEMVLFTKFLDTHRVVVMTDKHLYLLNDFEGNTLWKKPYELIKDIKIMDNKINILYGNSLETLSVNGDIDSKYSFTDNYSNIVGFSNFNLVYGDHNIMALKDGKEVYEEEVKDNILKVQPGKGRFIVVYKDKIIVYKVVD